MKCPHCHRDFDETLLIQDEPTRKAQAEEIYKLYPRKVGRPAALRAIMKALKTVSFAELKRRTVVFALAWDNCDTTYCAYPATWFGQERYNDDESTWAPRRQPERNGPPLFVQIQQLEQHLETHPANVNWIGYDRSKVTDNMRADYKNKRQKLEMLKQQQMNGI